MLAFAPNVIKPLSHITDARVVEPLIAALKDPDDLVRADCSRSLGCYRRPSQGRSHWIGALKDSNADDALPGCVIPGLHKTNEPRVVSSLIGALKDQER